jgi:hypothetical protein
MSRETITTDSLYGAGQRQLRRDTEYAHICEDGGR